MLSHNTRASAENRPCEERTDDRVTDTDPGGRDTEFPAELTGVADEDNGGEIRCTVSKGGQPGTDASASENKAVDVGSVAAAVDTNAYHDAEKQHQHQNFDYHICNTPYN